MIGSSARFAILLVLSGLLSSMASTEAQAPSNSLHLAKQSFELPGDGERNDNRRIGDFCCTGETATVQNDAGAPVGYIYFYDFPGGGINLPDGIHSIAGKFSLLVSGISDPNRAGSARVKNSILFDAGEMTAGNRKQITAGALSFTVIIEDAKLEHSSATKYFMDSVRCKVEVQPNQD
jgi:hypothetical protein